jgi:hypothetical protein
VVEAITRAQVRVDITTLSIAFDASSRFEVPRLDNYMRFKGVARGQLLAAPDAAAMAQLRSILGQAWPELIKAIDLPIGDRLTPDRNDIQVTHEGSQLTIAFDLEAD